MKPILFILSVYDDVIKEGKWKIIGELPLEDKLKIQPMQYIQDALNPAQFSLYDPNSGSIIPASKEECVGLECASVWEAEHVEDRIRDHYAGRTNVWVEQLKIKE